MESGAALWVRSTASRARGATAVVLPALPHHHCTSYTTLNPFPRTADRQLLGNTGNLQPHFIPCCLSVISTALLHTILSVNRLDNSLENKIRIVLSW